MDATLEFDPIDKLVQQAREYNSKGKTLFEQADFGNAFLAITQSMLAYQEALNLSDDEEIDFQENLKSCILTSSKFLEFIQNRSPSGSAKSAVSPATEDNNGQQCAQKNAEIRQQFESKIEPWVTGDGLKAIIGLAHLKSILYECILLLPGSKFAHHFSQKGGGTFNQHVLMIGAPGNGKTEIVKRYHEDAKGVKLLKILPSDILDRYIGEGEKKLASLFEVASQHAPLVIFFDEIDGLFGTSGENGLNMPLINQFLLLLRSAPNVQIIGATNRPWVLEESIRRRFDYIVHVPLPNRAERLKVLQLTLSPAVPSLTYGEFDEVAKMTKGYSCSDIARAAKECLKTPRQRVSTAHYFRRIRAPDDNVMWAPCEKSDRGAKSRRFTDFDDVQSIFFPGISIADLRRCVQKQKKTSEDAQKQGSLQSRMLDFAAKFGTDGRYGCSQSIPAICPPSTQDKCLQTALKRDNNPKPRVCMNRGRICPSAWDLGFMEVMKGDTRTCFTNKATQTGSDLNDYCDGSSLNYSDLNLHLEYQSQAEVITEAKSDLPSPNILSIDPGQVIPLESTVLAENSDCKGKVKNWKGVFTMFGQTFARLSAVFAVPFKAFQSTPEE